MSPWIPTAQVLDDAEGDKGAVATTVAGILWIVL